MPKSLFDSPKWPEPQVGKVYNYKAHKPIYVTAVDRNKQPVIYTFHEVDPKTHLLCPKATHDTGPLGMELPFHMQIFVHPPCYEAINPEGGVTRGDLKWAMMSPEAVISSMKTHFEKADRGSATWDYTYRLKNPPTSGPWQFFYNLTFGRSLQKRGTWGLHVNMLQPLKVGVRTRLKREITTMLPGVRAGTHCHCDKELNWDTDGYGSLGVGFPYPGDDVERPHRMDGMGGYYTRNKTLFARNGTKIRDSTATMGELRALWWVADFLSKQVFEPKDMMQGKQNR